MVRLNLITMIKDKKINYNNNNYITENKRHPIIHLKEHILSELQTKTSYMY